MTRFSPYDSSIAITGRVDRTDENGPRWDWPGISISFGFTGTSVTLFWNGSDELYDLILDGIFVGTRFVQSGNGSCTIESSSTGEGFHTVELWKRHESYRCPVQFLGIETDGELVAYKRATVGKMIVYGDSIAAGYGNQWPANGSGLPYEECYRACSSARESFVAFVAQHYHYDSHWIAYSGKGIVRNYLGDLPGKEMPYYWNHTLQTRVGRSDQSLWDSSNWIPALVLIHFGTNDFGGVGECASQDSFVEAYENLLSKIWNDSPDAQVVAISLPDERGLAQKSAIDRVCANRSEISTGKLSHFHYTKVDESLPWEGFNVHPGNSDHRRIAVELINHLEKVKRI